MCRTQVLLFLLLFYTVQGDDFFAKFHQSDYKIKNMRAEITRYDAELVNFFRVVTFKYNRTVAAINITVNYKIDILPKIQVIVQVYKKYSNKFLTFPIRFQASYCTGMSFNVAGLKAGAESCGNYSRCSYKKDTTYHLCNFVPDQSMYPPMIPDGEYKTELTFVYFNRECAELNFYGEIYRPIEIPK